MYVLCTMVWYCLVQVLMLDVDHLTFIYSHLLKMCITCKVLYYIYLESMLFCVWGFLLIIFPHPTIDDGWLHQFMNHTYFLWSERTKERTQNTSYAYKLQRGRERKRDDNTMIFLGLCPSLPVFNKWNQHNSSSV